MPFISFHVIHPNDDIVWYNMLYYTALSYPMIYAIIDHNWYRLDDTVVTAVHDCNDVKTPAAYVLFYKRKNVPTNVKEIQKEELDDEHKDAAQ
jgi:hypothetical protein